MGLPHVIAIPSPAQGHVIPMLRLMKNIATCGFKVTLVNTELAHQRVMNVASEKENNVGDIINFVSLPDGLEKWEDMNDLKKSDEAILSIMPKKLEELIEKFNLSDDDRVTCVIADACMVWPLEIAEKMKIKRAAFWPAATATLALMFSIRRMIDDGIIDNKGTPIGDQMIQLSPAMPTFQATDLPWARLSDSNKQEAIFQIILRNNTVIEATDWLICNSFYCLEHAACSLFPNIKPIGPLLANNQLGKSTGYFWREDSTCLEWLDQQPTNSVIYVAFGSSAVFDNVQFKELALGLEITVRPFLWVVRPKLMDDIDAKYPIGYEERIASRGRIVSWAPQQAVLSHPSVACFLSHCGWNSTLEGISKGVPFLCWPYFGDQFINRKYICDIWKVGLSFNPDEKGVISRQEIENKVEILLTDKSFKSKALNLKEMAANCATENGDSHNNFHNFIEWMKE